MGNPQYDKYVMKDGITPIDASYFNPIWKALDTRVVAVEDVGERADVAVEELVRTGLRRVDEFLAPAYQNIADLAELGFLSATIQDDGPVTFGLDVKTVIIKEGPERDQFRAAPYVTFQVGDDYEKVAVAVSLEYDRETGAYTVEFIALTAELVADPGPHSGIYISASAGSTIATMRAVQDAAAARDAAIQAKNDAASIVASAVVTAVAGANEAKDGAVAAKVLAESAAGSAAGSATQAQIARGILGAFVSGSFPSTRGDGSALQNGDLLWDITQGMLRAYDGANFVPTVTSSIGGIQTVDGVFGPAPSGVIAVPGGFTTVLVWLNGTLLKKDTDYTAATPNVTIPDATENDTYFVWAFKAVDATDYYTKEEINSSRYTKSEVDAAIGPAKTGTASSVTANATATAGARLYVNTSSGSVTVNLPPTPNAGEHVTVWRYGANPVTVARNGGTIEDLSENLVIDTDKKGVRFTFLFGTWKTFPAEVMP